MDHMGIGHVLPRRRVERENVRSRRWQVPDASWGLQRLTGLRQSPKGGRVTLHILLDSSSVEVVSGEGRITSSGVRVTGNSVSSRP